MRMRRREGRKGSQLLLRPFPVLGVTLSQLGAALSKGGLKMHHQHDHVYNNGDRREMNSFVACRANRGRGKAFIRS